MDIETEQLSRDFKQTFSTEHGKRVLKKLRSMCFAYPQAPIFDRHSERTTEFNLGMNWVFGYIQNQIDMKLDEPQSEDCIMEPEPEQKGH